MDPKQNKLSTGANVSRTMDNLNAEDGASYGGMSFSKHNFDKIEPGTGDIILNTGGDTKRPRPVMAPPKPAAEPVFTTNRSSTAYVPSEYQNPAPAKKSFVVNKKFLIGAAVVAVLVAGGIGGYFLVTQNIGKKSNSGSGSSSSVINTSKELGQKLLDELDPSIDSVEKIFYRAEDGTLSFSMLYSSDNEILADQMADGFSALETVSSTISKNMSKVPANLESEASALVQVIGQRSDDYLRAIDLMDTFHEAIVEIASGSDSKLKALANDEDEAIRQIANKLLSNDVSSDYVYDSGMIQKIIAAVFQSINYEADGTLSGRIEILAQKLLGEEPGNA